jgi:hypothetical protein
MYAFPRLTMPEGAEKAAAKLGKEADFMYCMELLDNTGIVTVPGSGFGQVLELAAACQNVPVFAMRRGNCGEALSSSFFGFVQRVSRLLGGAGGRHVPCAHYHPPA